MAPFISIRLLKAFFMGCLTAVVLLPANGNASSILKNVDVSFSIDESLTDTLSVDSNPKIIAGDDSSIGNFLLVDGEFIELGTDSITYRIFGAGLPVSTPGYTSSGYGSGEAFVFSNFEFFGNPHVALSSVSISLIDVINVQLGSDVTFDDHSLTLNLGQIGVADAGEDIPGFGTITLDLQFKSVPEPGTLILVGLGMAVLWGRFTASSRKRPIQSRFG